MRITSFDELQREIVSNTRKFNGLPQKQESVGDILTSVQRLREIELNLAGLVLCNMSDLYFTSAQESNRYGLKISALSAQISERMRNLRSMLSSKATIAANKRRLREPKWYGEVSSRLEYQSTRGYWTFAGLSEGADDPFNYELLYRIDWYRVKRMQTQQGLSPFGVYLVENSHYLANLSTWSLCRGQGFNVCLTMVDTLRPTKNFVTCHTSEHIATAIRCSQIGEG